MLVVGPNADAAAAADVLAVAVMLTAAAAAVVPPSGQPPDAGAGDKDIVDDEGDEQSLCTLIVGDAATKLLLLLVLLIVSGNCDGVPVGVCGDSGVNTEDVDTGLPMLLLAFVVTNAATVPIPDDVVFIVLFVAVVGVAGVDMATTEELVDCGAVVDGGDCC